MINDCFILSSRNFYKTMLIIPISQMRKPKVREVKGWAPNHTVGKQHSWDLNSHLSKPRAHGLSPTKERDRALQILIWVHLPISLERQVLVAWHCSRGMCRECFCVFSTCQHTHTHTHTQMHTDACTRTQALQADAAFLSARNGPAYSQQSSQE